MKFGHLDNVDQIDFTLPPDHASTSAVLKDLTPTKNPAFYIGCPVWSQREYVGKMYPRGTKPSHYLAEYCKQFNSIEVNATRYGIPKLDQVKQWRSVATEGFKFSLKFPQYISHRSNIGDREALRMTDEFLVAAYELGPHLGMTFLQLPPYFRPPKISQLEAMLDHLPNDFELAVEIRHTSWFTDSDYLQRMCDLLRDHDTSFIITDAAGRRDVIHQALTSDTLFVRYAGNVLHPSDFTRIDQWMDRITDWVSRGLQTIYFYMHQPAPHKYLSANLADYMIRHMNDRLGLQLKAPVDYSKDTLF